MKKQKTALLIKGKKGCQLNQREAKLINEHEVDGLLLFDVEQKSSGIVLRYNVDGLIPMTDFLAINPMSKRLFVVLMRSIVLSLKGIESNHFGKNLVMWSLSTTYVDPMTWNVYLMYVPLQPYETSGDLKSFLFDFAACCMFSDGENADYIRALITDLNSGISYTTYMLENLCNGISKEFLQADSAKAKAKSCHVCGAALREDESTCPFCGAKVGAPSAAVRKKAPEPKKNRVPVHKAAEPTSEKSTGGVVVSEDQNGVITVFRRSPNGNKTVWLEDRKSSERISIGKFPFRIGKMAGVTDYRIFDNTVSRRHADIIKEQGRFYIMDLDSTNGSYLGGKCLPVGEKAELYDGAVIRLANCEFVFHIE